MLDWLQTWPRWLQDLWFFYITFHDFLQWGIMLSIGYTAWGQQRQKKELRKFALALQEELAHVHSELHSHIEEDSTLHSSLGQNGITKGKAWK